MKVYTVRRDGRLVGVLLIRPHHDAVSWDVYDESEPEEEWCESWDSRRIAARTLRRRRAEGCKIARVA